ncbi:unnamed protein product [Leptidea sinapis]|uniref:CCHC-type domain-containing protein n=1 Tax=Leptidea sinapis TaxID=189913 RepID=A0A5E4PSH5_9NEOP|nr:unnamed protein product [Leptidea sinapis]
MAPANAAPVTRGGGRRRQVVEPAKPTELARPMRREEPNRQAQVKVNLKAPSTAAVVITLRKEALADGATYAQALAAAKERVSLTEIGVQGVRTRKMALGGRILEIGGPKRNQQDDRFAEELRGALEGIATVNRPVKSADVRISGLEDSVTVEDVVAAIAAKGECPSEQVRAGRLVMGSLIITCPVTAARAITQGRLCIGWSVARVTLLGGRPLRCFRCYGTGHCALACTAKDRSGLCCRCGKAGHIAQGCTAIPHCDICADAGAPAGHRMGGRSCNSPLIREKRKAVGTLHSLR